MGQRRRVLVSKLAEYRRERRLYYSPVEDAKAERDRCRPGHGREWRARVRGRDVLAQCPASVDVVVRLRQDN